MNHDATHCADYLKSKCPKKCYRAQLTQDLKDNFLFFLYMTTSWANFKETKECPLYIQSSEKDFKNIQEREK